MGNWGDIELCKRIPPSRVTQQVDDTFLYMNEKQMILSESFKFAMEIEAKTVAFTSFIQQTWKSVTFPPKTVRNGKSGPRKFDKILTKSGR